MSEPCLRTDRTLSPTDLHFLRSLVWPVVGSADTPPHVRECEQCGADVSWLGPKTRFCEQCSYIRTRENQKRYWREHHPKDVKRCLGCGEDISGMHGRRRRCVPCQQDYERGRQREKARRARCAV